MQIRQLSTAFLIATLMASSAPVGAFAQGYIDPSAYAPAIASLSSTGVIDGGGNVRLDDYVNRAEALKIILMAQPKYAQQVARVKEDMPPISLFPDVTQTSWFAPYIEVGFRYGLIKGYPDGRFWPQGGVKIAEASAMLVRSFGEQSKNVGFLTSNDLPNIDGQWYTGALSAIHSRGAVMPGSMLSAGNYMTRGQLFDMVYRYRESVAGGVTTAAIGTQVPVYSVTNSSYSSSQAYVPAPVAPSTLTATERQFASKKDFAITIPSLGIVDLTITHPSDPYSQKGVLEPLQQGVGHLFSYPGNGGKVMIYGHSSGYPWDLSQFTKIFRGINKVNVGDRVYVTYGGSLHVYQVTEKKTVPARDTAAFEPDERGEELVLYTCWPPDSITNRYLVYATPVETIALR